MCPLPKIIRKPWEAIRFRHSGRVWVVMLPPHIRLGTPGARFNYLARQCPGDYDPNMPSVSVLNVLINVILGNQAKRTCEGRGDLTNISR